MTQAVPLVRNRRTLFYACRLAAIAMPSADGPGLQRYRDYSLRHNQSWLYLLCSEHDICIKRGMSDYYIHVSLRSLTSSPIRWYKVTQM